MPYKKKYNKKKRTMYKRRQIIGRPPSRPLAAPRPYLFKRHISEVQQLSPTNGYWVSDVNNLGKAFAFFISVYDRRHRLSKSI